MTSPTASWAGRQALVTGGLGFLGSAVVRALIARGASVRVLDALLPQGGGSPRNVRDVPGTIDVVIDDTRSRDAVERAVQGCDVVFHLAGHAGFSALAPNWYTEIDSACLGTLNLLEAIRVHSPQARMVFASALSVYGNAAAQPIAETAPTEPQTLFAVHKLAGEKYCQVFHAQHGVRAVVARIAALFGPRQRLSGAANGCIANIVDAAIHEERILLPDDGAPLCDLLFVNDAAHALLEIASGPESLNGSVVNVGRGTGHSLADASAMLIRLLGHGEMQLLPPAGPAGGGLVADTTRLRSIIPNWSPLPLEAALERTVRWYGGDTDAA